MTLIHQDANARALDFLKIWVFGAWLMIMVIDPFPDLAYIPDSVIRPAGVLVAFLPHSLQMLIFTTPFLYGLKALAVVSILVILFRRDHIPALLTACLCLILHQGIVRSFGKMKHTGNVLLYAAILLALFTLADYLWRKKERAYPPQVNPYSIPFIVILFVICLTYTFIGSYRFIHGVPATYSIDTMTHWVVTNSHKPHFFNPQLDGVYLQNPWIQQFFKVGFCAATVFEITAPFCLISRWYRYVFIGVMIPMHVIIFLFMGILFWETFYLYILFFDFTPLFARGGGGQIPPREVASRDIINPDF